MKAVSLLYHDVIEANDFESSGFPGAEAAIYKLNIADLERHFQSISEHVSVQPSSVVEYQRSKGKGNIPLFITFDDGGRSAALHIADLLERYGWIGHFFITTDYINTEAFVTEDHIRDLWSRGHIIGSHSSSHPERMSRCGREQLEGEWKESVGVLSGIVGERITCASVPGGSYSRRVAEAASRSGITTLFTSEPIKRCEYVDDCLVLGRYTVLRGMPPEVSAGFVSIGLSSHQARQYLYWNSKKLLKIVFGPCYTWMRRLILRRR